MILDVKYICHLEKHTCQMEGIKKPKEPILLPAYFKVIGVIIIVLALITAIVIKSMQIEMYPSQKELFRLFTMNAFLLGLLLVAWSKDKMEDEMTVFIRLKAMAWTFTWAVLYVILKPIGDLIFDDPVEILTGQEVVTSMLFVYLITYFFQKRWR